MIIVAIILLLGLLGYISYYCWKIDTHMINYRTTEEDIARERKVMTAEKRHFGRHQLMYERQSKEYKKWRKELNL